MKLKMKLSAAVLAFIVFAFAGTAFAGAGMKKTGGDDVKIKAAMIKLHEARVKMHEAKVSGESEAVVNEAIDNFTKAMGELMKLNPESMNFFPMPPAWPMGHMRPAGPMHARGWRFNGFPPPPPFVTGENFQGPGMCGPHGFNNFPPPPPMPPMMRMGRHGFHRGPKNFNAPGRCPMCGHDFAGKKYSNTEKPEEKEISEKNENAPKSDVWQGKCWRK